MYQKNHFQNKPFIKFLFVLCFSFLICPAFSEYTNPNLFIPNTETGDEEAIIDKEQAAKSVWRIVGEVYSGSSFFVSENKVVTNYHVISELESGSNVILFQAEGSVLPLSGLESGSNVILFQAQGEERILKVKRIAALSILNDLAILEIEGVVSDFLSLPVEDLDASKNLYALGYPGGRFQEIKQTGVLLKDDKFFMDHVDGYADVGGISGSPVLNESHQLVGIVYAKDNSSLSFINAQTLKSLIESEHCFR